MLILNYSYCEQNVTSFLLSSSLILYLRLLSHSSESALSSDMEIHSDPGFAEIDVNSDISTMSYYIVLGSWYSVCVRRKLRISNSILRRKSGATNARQILIQSAAEVVRNDFVLYIIKGKVTAGNIRLQNGDLLSTSEWMLAVR
jgi:hypothetical protein